MSDTNSILTPLMLWSDFDTSLPLKESKTGDVDFENVSYREIYFSGRECSDGRVRIFGVYATEKQIGRKQPKSAILILPNYDETVNFETINLFVKKGYAVLMIDYRGDWEGCENSTKYPASISYANYKNAGRHLDYADSTVKETCWYEWAAVSRYAVSYLKSKPEIEKIGVLGIKNGANVGWMLCGTDDRCDCFCSLFGAGWRAYHGIFKNSEIDLEMNEEKVKFVAGADAQSYAQYVKCPVLYMTATNSSEFDCERAVDTLIRLNEDVNSRLNFAPLFRDALDKYCLDDLDMFFENELSGGKNYFPDEPTLTLSTNNSIIEATLGLNYSELRRIKSISVYFSEGEKNPAFRDWRLMTESKTTVDNKKTFSAVMNGNSTFVNAFAKIVCKNGVSVCSKIVSKKIPLTKVRHNKLIYSQAEGTTAFNVYSVKKYAQAGLFLCDENYLVESEGDCGINGVSSKYGLISYCVNERFTDMNEFSIIVMDVFCEDYAELKLTLIFADKNGKEKEYFTVLGVKGAKHWQNILVKCTDFKSDEHFSIRDYSTVSALKIENETKCIINNVVLV